MDEREMACKVQGEKMSRIALMTLLTMAICCRSYPVVAPGHTRESAWVTREYSAFGMVLTQKLYYCYAEQKKSMPTCLPAEFVNQDVDNQD
jgi:hypothetical protein